MQFGDQLEQMVEYSQQALEEFRALDNRSMVANCLGMLSEAYHARGDVVKARRRAEEGVQISEAIENPWGIGYNTWVLMITDTAVGRFDRALARVKTLETVIAKIPIPLIKGVSDLRVAQIYFEPNQLDRAHTLAAEAFDILGQLESQAWAFWSRGSIAGVWIRQGKFDEAHKVLEPFRQSRPETVASKWVLGMVAPAALELGLIEGRYKQELEFFNRLLDQVNIEPMQAYVAESLYLRGRIYLKLSEWAQADRDLNWARGIAVHAEDNLLLWRVEEAYAQLYATRGEQDQARSMHARAVRRIREIAANISDPILRASFLGRQDIKELLSE